MTNLFSAILTEFESTSMSKWHTEHRHFNEIDITTIAFVIPCAHGVFFLPIFESHKTNLKTQNVLFTKTLKALFKIIGYSYNLAKY